MNIFRKINFKFYFLLVALLSSLFIVSYYVFLQLSSSKTSSTLYRGIVHYSIRQEYKAINITIITTAITIATPIPTPTTIPITIPIPNTLIPTPPITITTPIPPTIASTIPIPTTLISTPTTTTTPIPPTVASNISIPNTLIPTPPTTTTTPIPPTIASNISIPAKKRRMPDIVMIGAAKCGTGAILSMLGMHPNIKLGPREPEFYSYNFHLGLEWYINSMPLVGDDQLLMEKTPNYFYIDEVAQRLYDAKPDTMIILVVIDPVERVMSHFVHVKSKKSAKKFNHTFEEFVIDKNSGKVHSKKQYIVDMGLYGKQFRNWVKYFPPEQIIVLNGKLLVHEPWVIMEQIQTFLDVSQFITKNMFTFVEEKKFYCFGVDNHKCLGHTKGRPHPKMPPSVRDKLQTFYKESNEEFFKLLKKTNQKVILNWGY